MRIDVSSNSIRPDVLQNKNSADTFEFKNRGENVRGKVLDVNQNMVLIQTSSGKEFLATTVIPMENYIGEDILFQITVGEDGNIQLKPELDQKELQLASELKLEDTLGKINQPPTKENKEIAKEMIKAGFPITQESFKEIKDLKLAMNLLTKVPEENFAPKDAKLPVDILVRLNDFSTVEGELKETILPKTSGIKDVIILKELKMEITPENLTALKDIQKGINDKSIDIMGLKNLFEGKASNLNGEKLTTPMNMNLQGETIAQNVLPKENTALQKILSNMNEFEIKSSDKPEIQNNTTSKEDKALIREILLQMVGDSKKNLKGPGKTSGEEIRLDPEKISEDLKTVLKGIDKESSLAKTIEKDILPKAEILKEFAKELNLHLLPFQLNEYENVAQYYFKKNKQNEEKKQGLTVAISLNTFSHGNVRSMVYYGGKDNLSIQLFTEKKEFEDRFRKSLGDLKTSLGIIGFSNVSVDVHTQMKSSEIMDDLIYPNINQTSYETWV